MSRYRFHTSGTGGGGFKSRALDPSERFAKFGRVLPMDDPPWLEKIIRRR